MSLFRMNAFTQIEFNLWTQEVQCSFRKDFLCCPSY